MEHQDWQQVVIRKKAPSSSQQRKDNPQQVNQAMRQGQVEAVRKAGQAPKGQGVSGARAAKIENETEEFKHERVSGDMRKTIQQARQAKGMSQADLAKAINENSKVVQEYEKGSAIPNANVLGKMEKHLGVKLRGKKGGK